MDPFCFVSDIMIMGDHEEYLGDVLSRTRPQGGSDVLVFVDFFFSLGCNGKQVCDRLGREG